MSRVLRPNIRERPVTPSSVGAVGSICTYKNSLKTSHKEVKHSKHITANTANFLILVFSHLSLLIFISLRIFTFKY